MDYPANCVLPCRYGQALKRECSTAAGIGKCTLQVHNEFNSPSKRTLMITLMRQLIFIALWLTAISSSADQNDPRLDDLFAGLHATDDLAVGTQLTREIWVIWREIDDETTHALMREGIRDMAEQRYGSALTSFDKVVELAPDYAEGWNKRATLYYLMGENSKSAADVKQTLKLEPRHFGALAGLGLLYMQIDNFNAALEAFGDALGVNPHLPGAKRNIEIIEQTLKDTEI